jgi:glycosyltransferase involved in cell wall biosynthesis
MDRIPVSAVIIALNEEKNISRCLNSLFWADEILVVDGGSTDQTVPLCKRAGYANQQANAGLEKIRVLDRVWDGFRNQRNFAIRSAKYDWIFAIDADEECSSELANKLQELLSLPEGPPLKAYQVRRIEYFLGKQIRGGIWNPSYQDRFFHRFQVEYVNDIHEYPLFRAEPGRIHEPLHHSPDFTVEKFLQKMNRYTSIEAQDRVKMGKKTNLFRLFFAFPAMFLKNYFYYKGYQDGMHGFVISLLEGLSRVVRHIKIWQYSRNQKNLKL